MEKSIKNAKENEAEENKKNYKRKKKKLLKYKIVSRLKQDFQQWKYALLILVGYGGFMQLRYGTVCPILAFSGHRCPGCGITRGCLCILTGQWHRAWDYNAMAYIWLPLLIGVILFRYLADEPKLGKLFWSLIVAAGILSVIYYLCLYKAAEWGIII